MKTFQQFMEEAPKRIKYGNYYHGTRKNDAYGIRRNGFWDSTKRYNDPDKGRWSEKGRVFVTPDKEHAKSRGRLGPAADSAKKDSKVLNLKLKKGTDKRQMPKKERNYTISQKDADQGLKVGDTLGKNKIRRKRK